MPASPRFTGVRLDDRGAWKTASVAAGCLLLARPAPPLLPNEHQNTFTVISWTLGLWPAWLLARTVAVLSRTPTRVATNRLELIQLLRGAAALLVVLLHFRTLLSADWPWLDRAMAHGQIGVDIFFIISGFVIYVSTAQPHSRTPRGFLIRRFFRVVIPAWTAMFVLLCVRPPILHDLLLSVFFVPLQNSHPPSYGYNFLIVAWTLTYELAFYCVFALAMTTRLGRQHRGLLASIMILAMLVSIQALTGTFTLNADAAGLLRHQTAFPLQIVSLLGNPLFLEFVIGIGLAWVYLRGLFERLGTWRYALVASGALLGPIIVKVQYSDGHGLTHSGLLAALIVIIALTLQSLVDAAKRRDGMHWAVLIGLSGELSYSVYLVHPIVKTVALSQPGKSLWADHLGPLAAFFLLLAGTVLVAYLFYRYVELPAQNFGKKLSGRRDRQDEHPAMDALTNAELVQRPAGAGR